MNTPANNLWIHIVPKGELPNEAAGLVQVLDDVSLRTLLAEIEGEKARLGNRWPGIYAGREHHIYDEGQDSAALAWFKDFDLRSDGIWASGAGLTDLGREAVANGRYKFTSFVADRDDLEYLGDDRYRVLKLDTVGFTNLPNGKDLLSPITNRQFVFNTAACITESLSPRAAGEEFSRIVNRVKTERGCTFDTAWNLCRSTESALFNRMAATEQPQRNARQTNPSAFAGLALRVLTDEEQRARGGTFTDAWQRVANRRADLMRLANRDGSQTDWTALSDAAWAKFYSGIKLDPDGRVLKIVPDMDASGNASKHSTRSCFENTYNGILRRDPNLSPADAWRQMREEFPEVFWPFVAMTGESGE